MKLRNKKTGEIVNFQYLQNDYIASLVLTVIRDDGKPVMYTYNSLAELNEDWEDYEEKEPLIKDEKIDYLEIKRLVKEAMREAEEERAKRLVQYYDKLCGEEDNA